MGIAAWLGWLFDGLEMGLFPLVQRPALRELVGTDEAVITGWIAVITSFFLIGAATGGVLFGWLGDRIGRVRSMMLSVLTYALVSGLCGFADQAWQIGILRFVAASFETYCMQLAGQRTLADLRVSVFAHIQQLSIRYFDRTLRRCRFRPRQFHPSHPSKAPRSQSPDLSGLRADENRPECRRTREPRATSGAASTPESRFRRPFLRPRSETPQTRITALSQGQPRGDGSA